MGRGVVTCALALTLSACGSSKVQINSPDLSRTDAEACTALVEALPDTLGGELRRSVDPEDAPGAAWGDPAYVLTCGVARPDEWAPDSECSDIGGVGWFVPLDELEDQRVDLTATALTHTPYVSLVVPSRYRSEGLDLALSELAPHLKQHLEAGEPCL